MVNKAKNALLIMPKFYGYEEVLRAEFLRIYQSVFLIFENVDGLTRYGTIGRRIPWAWEHYVDKYYEEKIHSIDVDVEVVFIIRGASISPRTFKLLKSTFSNALFVLYEWDSIANLPNARSLADGCDLVHTFDPVDAQGEGWNYLPLFHHAITGEDCHRDIDVIFTGAMHTDRALILDNLATFCSARGLNLFHYLYSNGSKAGFYFKKAISQRSSFALFRKGEVMHFDSIPLLEMDSLYSRSRIVVDYAHPAQNGLTMRTIESVGHSCKLVTNNRNVINADFFNPKNIHVYDGLNPDIPDDFLRSAYDPLPSELVGRYAVTNWVERALGGAYE